MSNYTEPTTTNIHAAILVALTDAAMDNTCDSTVDMLVAEATFMVTGEGELVEDAARSTVEAWLEGEIG